jgi:hypothetical protein
MPARWEIDHKKASDIVNKEALEKKLVCKICKYTRHIAENCPKRCRLCDVPNHTREDCTVTCTICNKLGHRVNTCRSVCERRQCLGLEYHNYYNCTNVPLLCDICDKNGHVSQDCRSICHKCPKSDEPHHFKNCTVFPFLKNNIISNN